MTRILYDAKNRITNFYNPKNHFGIDLGWETNEGFNKIYPHSKGKIVELVDGKDNEKTGNSYGNYVKIDHGNGYQTLYAHMQKGLKVKKGQTVDNNTVIGIMGSSGYAFGRHLHFEVWKNGARINPFDYLTKDFEDVKQVVNNTKNFKVGDSVFVNGFGYSTALGTGLRTQTYKNQKMKIIKIHGSGTHRLGLNQYNTNGGITAWFKESDCRK